MAQPGVDSLQDLRVGQEDAFLPFGGHLVVGQDEFPLQVGYLEVAVVLVQHLRFLRGEPVGESALGQCVGLGVDGRVVHGMLVRAVDALHLEGHPAAVAAEVVEEVDVVAGAAEAGEVGPALLVVGVGRAFVDGAQGGEGLELVHLLAFQLVQLLQADDGELRERQRVVLREVAAVGLQVEVPAQFVGQQVVQPGGLVDALPSGQH